MRVRLAGFKFLEEQVRLLGEVLPLNVLRQGFSVDGRRVPLMNAVQGIFRPAVLPDMPLSITTTAPKERQEQPSWRDGRSPQHQLFHIQFQRDAYGCHRSMSPGQV
jgi:hypothetical protein